MLRIAPFSSYFFNSMDTDVAEQEEIWLPNLSPKQQEIFNAGTLLDAGNIHPECPTALLVSGARKTGKTLGVCHRVCRHLWETPGARVALLSKTIRSMTDGGIWQDLLEIVMPEWLEAGIGFQYTTKDNSGTPGPKMDSKTRTIFFRIRNMHGGESELKLLSLQFDQEVKEKLKNSRYSMIWFSELSLFRDPDVFRTSIMQLRMVHLKPWQHLWIADTNPSDEGEQSWIYKQWYLRRVSDEVSAYVRALRLIEVLLDDNPFLTEGEKDFQRSLYQDDVGEYDREVEGKWTKGHGDKGKHFSDIFVRQYHVIGGGEGESDQIEPDPSTDALMCGWDLGSVNHAACILERRWVEIQGQEWSVWAVLDDLCYVGEKMTLAEFTLEFLTKMDALEAKFKAANRKIVWQHWSDDSALNVFRPTGASYDYLEVQAASGGRINLNGVQKPEKSVQLRVKLLRRLLREKRIYVSSRCEATIEMLEECRKGPNEREFVAHDKSKHAFDALTYPIFIESTYELSAMQRPNAQKGKGGLISVPL